MKPQNKTRKNICDNLTNQWEEFNKELFENNTMSTALFKTLLKNTWEYFYTDEQRDYEKMLRCDAMLLSKITPILNLNQYPENVEKNQFQAAIRFVSEFTSNLIFPLNFYNRYNFWEGWISLKSYYDYPEQYIHIDDFEKAFEKLCDEYFDEEEI